MAKKAARGSGLQKQLDYSEELENILLDVGYKKQSISRADATKQIWVYIKKHKLQDEEDGRIILCDSNLKTLSNKKELKMTQIGKVLSDHLWDYEEEEE